MRAKEVTTDMTSRFGSLRVFCIGIALAIAGCGSSVSTEPPTQTVAAPTPPEAAISPSVPLAAGDLPNHARVNKTAEGLVHRGR